MKVGDKMYCHKSCNNKSFILTSGKYYQVIDVNKFDQGCILNDIDLPTYFHPSNKTYFISEQEQKIKNRKIKLNHLKTII